MSGRHIEQGGTIAGMKNEVRDPEWIRPRQVKELFGIGQAHAALMIRDGRVKSVSLCPPGKATGTRLISFPSLCAYLDQLAAEQQAQSQAAQEGGAA
ncbi:hypothetical protein OJ996_18835 [Luteolibacter sp. GHJ8]|uniref:Pyocin activator protein PrtN n=1 Tax=Luteolibacter rhizosphaerae TaxID=2989719 RepID=A0ABT3G723_9BACT|nr:hypothetical protein [Luteolibacter rhizosphaerae]MCW1915649.1 hypothetical protein [Luteolibacter rhizosphaerae]